LQRHFAASAGKKIRGSTRMGFFARKPTSTEGPGGGFARLAGGMLAAVALLGLTQTAHA